MDTGAPSRNRTGTPAIHEAADFKSAVSTNFTIGAVRRVATWYSLSLTARHAVLADFGGVDFVQKYRPNHLEITRLLGSSHRLMGLRDWGSSFQ